jgi:hypothetical protein
VLNIILMAVVMLVGIWFYLRWREANGFNTPEGRIPERRFVVEVSDAGVRCQVPKGHSDEMTWDDLRTVDITVNQRFALGRDVWWILGGEESGVVAPVGATGESELVDRLIQLPGFDRPGMERALRAQESVTVRVWTDPRLEHA